MSFDRLAPFYRTMELVLAGGKLQRCRLAWIDAVSDSSKILLAGEGHGRFLEVCARCFPRACITYVDSSRRMLEIAAARWKAAGGQPDLIQFVRAELPDWQPEEAVFDLIVTNFFLDCFPPGQLEAVIRTLGQSASPCARWLVADFTVPPGGWRKWRSQAILALAYGFFRQVTDLPARQLVPPDGFLEAAGFSLQSRSTSEWGLLRSDLWARQVRPSRPQA